MLKGALIIFQIVSSVFLVILILIQTKGTGLGRTFGGGNVSFTRRGVEKIVFKSTFAVSVFFILVSLITLAL